MTNASEGYLGQEGRSLRVIRNFVEHVKASPLNLPDRSVSRLVPSVTALTIEIANVNVSFRERV